MGKRNVQCRVQTATTVWRLCGVAGWLDFDTATLLSATVAVAVAGRGGTTAGLEAPRSRTGTAVTSVPLAMCVHVRTWDLRRAALERRSGGKAVLGMCLAERQQVHRHAVARCQLQSAVRALEAAAVHGCVVMLARAHPLWYLMPLHSTFSTWYTFLLHTLHASGSRASDAGTGTCCAAAAVGTGAGAAACTEWTGAATAAGSSLLLRGRASAVMPVLINAARDGGARY